MATYKHLIKERFDVDITTANQSFRAEFELDKNAQFLYGIALTSDRDDLLFYRGSQKIQLNDVELFPEGFESKLLISGLNVPPNERIVLLGNIPTGNGKIDFLYKDTPHPSVSFTPHRVTLYAFSLVTLDESR
jgi:hypothetical protein